MLNPIALRMRIKKGRKMRRIRWSFYYFPGIK
jgi:hypothetical protein